MTNDTTLESSSPAQSSSSSFSSSSSISAPDRGPSQARSNDGAATGTMDSAPSEAASTTNHEPPTTDKTEPSTFNLPSSEALLAKEDQPSTGLPTNPIIHKSTNPFCVARILQQIGHARITRFLDSFEADLKAVNLSPPPPLPATHFYFGEVADFFADTDNLPARLLQAVAVIETAAAPEHAERLNALIHAHIPDCTATHHLDRAPWNYGSPRRSF